MQAFYDEVSVPDLVESEMRMEYAALMSLHLSRPDGSTSG